MKPKRLSALITIISLLLLFTSLALGSTLAAQDDTSDPEATPEATAEPDDELAITIIIEGPVEAININIITIFGIDVEVDPEEPILAIIEIGETIRIEGNVSAESDTLLIIVVNIVIVDIDVFINDDGDAWRDSGNCNNGPPPWAPAHGWRRRCEGGGKKSS